MPRFTDLIGTGVKSMTLFFFNGILVSPFLESVGIIILVHLYYNLYVEYLIYLFSLSWVRPLRNKSTVTILRLIGVRRWRQRSSVVGGNDAKQDYILVTSASGAYHEYEKRLLLYRIKKAKTIELMGLIFLCAIKRQFRVSLV